MPIFSSRLPSEMPGACASTMNAVTRCFVLPSTSTGDLGEHGEEVGVAGVRDPDLRAAERGSACRRRSATAVVFIACASEPEPGSVRQKRGDRSRRVAQRGS